MAHLPTDLMSEIDISTPKLFYNSPPLTPTWIDDTNFLLTTLEKLLNWIPSTDSQGSLFTSVYGYHRGPCRGSIKINNELIEIVKASVIST